jgi:transposase InsO family protein
VAHRRAKLTPFGRLLLVTRIEEAGWSVAVAAESLGVSRATAHKWLRRFREEGVVGLQDRSSAPTRRPRSLPRRQVRSICRARRRLKVGPHRLSYELEVPRSTIYGVLRRHGLSRLAHLDRPSAVVVRYERERPGELIHVDVKKLGRIPPGGGHRAIGRLGRTNSGLGYDFLHVAIDDHSRLAFVRVAADDRGPTCARFLVEAAAFFAEHGISIERVMTDNAFAYTRSAVFGGVVDALGVRHRTIRFRRPQTNGKVERFNRTLLDEWAYVRLYASNEERLGALQRWVASYNRVRPHTALGGHPPISRVSTT